MISLESVKRERASQEGEGHAIPRLAAVLEVNAGDAALGGSVFRHPDMINMPQDFHQRLLDVLIYRFACTAVPGMTWKQLWVSA